MANLTADDFDWLVLVDCRVSASEPGGGEHIVVLPFALGGTSFKHSLKVIQPLQTDPREDEQVMSTAKLGAVAAGLRELAQRKRDQEEYLAAREAQEAEDADAT